MKAWYAVDLDATLAEYNGWPKDGSIGKPIPAMIEKVKQMLAEGKDVRIFTARIWPIGVIAPEATDRLLQATEQHGKIQLWCKEHIGKFLPITCIKDYAMINLFDDRTTQIIKNTGKTITEMFKEDFYIRHDHYYSGLEIYNWLRKIEKGQS